MYTVREEPTVEQGDISSICSEEEITGIVDLNAVCGMSSSLSFFPSFISFLLLFLLFSSLLFPEDYLLLVSSLCLLNTRSPDARIGLCGGKVAHVEMIQQSSLHQEV